MTCPAYFASFTFRHAFAVACVVFFAVCVNQYYSMSHEVWLVMTAFLVSQTTRGTPLRQGVNYFFVIIVAILVAMLLQMYVANSNVLIVIAVSLFFLVSCVTFIYRPLTNYTFYLLILFPLILLIAMVTPIKNTHVMYARLMDVLCGGVIGIVFGQIIFPVRVDTEFRQGLIPLLRALTAYSHDLIDCLHEDKNRDSLNDKRDQIESALQSQQGMYPEWVYEVGFNRGLRGGFRFFLVNLERVTELYFSLDCLARSGLDVGVMLNLSQHVELSLEKNNELINVLIEYFVNEKITATTSDYTSDLSELEKTLRQHIPGSIDLLDISPEYVKLTAFVRDIKDMREMLLQLVLALPSA